MKNKTLLFILISIGIILILIIGIIYFLFAGKTFNKESISNNKSINYSSKMLNEIYNKDTNVLYSDLTLNPTLALFYYEGNDKVKNEMKNYFDIDSEVLLSNYDKINHRYKNAYKKVDYASALWINTKDHGISKDAKEIATKKLHFDINETDFSNSNTAATINKWIKKKSHGKVDNVIEQNNIIESHSVLVSTLYFNEKWNGKYENDDISHGVFHGVNGDDNVVFMDSEENDYLYNDVALGFMKPYKDTDLYFVGIIPQEGHTLAEINIPELMKTRRHAEVKVRIPEFEYDYTVDIGKHLENIGIKSIFEAGNLDNISSDLKVDKILQKNYIKVSRKGTIAFSVNIDMNSTWGSISGINSVYLDEPFIFLIYDKSIDQALFIGQVNNIKNSN